MGFTYLSKARIAANWKGTLSYGNNSAILEIRAKLWDSIDCKEYKTAWDTYSCKLIHKLQLTIIL